MAAVSSQEFVLFCIHVSDRFVRRKYKSELRRPGNEKP